MDQERIEAFLRRTTLRQIEVVLALHQHQTMTKAASALGMSVVNVSRTSQRFENNLDTRIFEGDSRRRVLSASSNEIFDYLKPLHVETERLRVRLGKLPQGDPFRDHC